LPAGAPPAETRQKFRSYLHVLGTDPAKDLPVFGFGVVPSIDVDPSWIASIQIRSHSQYAIGLLNGSTTPNGAYYITQANTIGKPGGEWRKIAGFSDGVTGVSIHGDDLYVRTYNGSPRFKILRLDARKPDLQSAETVVPAGEAVITGMLTASDALYVQLLDGGVGRLLRVPYGPHPRVERVALPFDGSVEMDGDPRLPGLFLIASSWTKAFRTYRYDPTSKQVTDTAIQPIGLFDTPQSIQSVEVKAPAADGTLIPLSIIHSKGMKLDGSNPTLLDGYGAYGNTMEPFFDPTMLAWFERGGVYAICHVRGGGEYGEEWHLAGKGPTKPNTWRDFIACAQYLIEHRYTSPVHLAGKGTSAGGILIGRAITERPDLFAAAIDKVGVSDTLRFELTQNGETNIPEFGTTKTEAGFKDLYAMSAYEHVEHGAAYPAVLLETGMNDPRVDPWQMAKMTARLQAATSSKKPILLHVDFAGGHGSMSSTQNQRDEALADEWSFLLWQLGVAEFQPR
jgi:prolyl oligopeptidase